MAELFHRRVALDVGPAGAVGERIEGIRIVVSSRRTRSGSADPAAVTAYNAPPTMIGRLQDEGIVTRVLAGYGDQLTQIAYGTMVRGSLRGPQRQGADLVTSWQVLDGGTSYQTSAVMRGWVGSVRASRVWRTLASDVGIPIAGFEVGDDVELPRNYFVSGTLRRALDDLASASRSTWTIVGGRLYVWPSGSPRVDSAVVLDYGSGLIEPPSRVDARRWQVRALLMPGIMPGDRYVVEADPGRGRYVAADVAHEIDSLGYGAFATTIVGVTDG